TPLPARHLGRYRPLLPHYEPDGTRRPPAAAVAGIRLECRPTNDQELVRGRGRSLGNAGSAYPGVRHILPASVPTRGGPPMATLWPAPRRSYAEHVDGNRHRFRR